MIRLTINNIPLEVPENITVLRAAETAGIVIPTLCDHPDLTPYGGCRLCLVEVQGARLPATACTLPVSPGMVVQAESPALTQARRAILELLISAYYDSRVETTNYTNEHEYNHTNTIEPRGETQLLHWARHYGIDLPAVMAKVPRYPVDSDPNPFIRVDLNKCILCTRCIRACAEVQGRFVWGLAGRGYNTHIAAGLDTPLLEARCESCGACAAYCPTGALDHKLSFDQGLAERLVTTTCTYCGVGCQVELNVRNNRILRVTSSPQGPVNGMALCVKGRYGYDFVHHSDRLARPRLRRYLLDDLPAPGSNSSLGSTGSPSASAEPVEANDWVEVDWDTALQITANRLRTIRDTAGPDSIGLLTSAKCTNEENYLMNKLARQVIGTNNIDHCARL